MYIYSLFILFYLLSFTHKVFFIFYSPHFIWPAYNHLFNEMAVFGCLWSTIRIKVLKGIKFWKLPLWDIKVVKSNILSSFRACRTRPAAKLNRRRAMQHSKTCKREAVPKPGLYHETWNTTDRIHIQIWLLKSLWIRVSNLLHLAGCRQQSWCLLLGLFCVWCWNVHVYSSAPVSSASSAWEFNRFSFAPTSPGCLRSGCRRSAQGVVLSQVASPLTVGRQHIGTERQGLLTHLCNQYPGANISVTFLLARCQHPGNL